jgi:hypothetical protein
MSKSIWADSDWRSLKVIIKLCSLLSKLKCYLQIVWCASISFLSCGHQSLLKFGQVQWDEPSSIIRPDRISPWEVEPLDAANPLSPQHPLRNKRARPLPSPSMVPELPSAFGKHSLLLTKYRSSS